VAAPPGDLGAAFGIDPGKRFQILVEGGTHGAIGVVVAPLPACARANFDSAANQLLAEVDELLDAFPEDGKLSGVVSLDDRFPVFDDRKDLIVELEKPFAILFHDGRFRRHIDAAGFHHDRIDQRVDALDIESGVARRLDCLRKFRVPTGVIVGQYSYRRGQKSEQSEDRVQPGRERKPGRNGIAERGAARFHRARHRRASP
jgi:hypothetical protein